jgi:DNA invertase Pin-like site-specific DNA recombinase
MQMIAYYRVSTAKQGRAGLGLDAQAASVAAFVQERGATVVASFTEIESGKRNERPELTKAVQAAKLTGSTLLIGKLDRLSRDLHFLTGLQKAGVKFVAADMPDANEITVPIIAAMAQFESQMISKRTKEALAAAKARGVRLGNPNGARALRDAAQGNRASLAVIKAKAQERARDLKSIVEDIKRGGATSWEAIARELNARGIQSPRMGVWYGGGVARMMNRLNA